jgi:hypothetical protein
MFFLEGSAPALPKNSRHIRICALQFFNPLQQVSFFVATDFSLWLNWVVGEKGVIKVALGLVPDGSFSFERPSPFFR